MKSLVISTLLVLLGVWCDTAGAEQEYLAVLMNGQKVGYAIHERTVSGDKVTTTEKVKMTMSRMGVDVTVTTEETHIETIDGKPLGFKMVQDMGIMAMTVEGAIGADGTVQVTTKSGASEQRSSFPWPTGALMMEGANLLMLEKGLKEGTRYTTRAFRAAMMQALDADVCIGERKKVDLLGRVVELTEVVTTMSMGGQGQIFTISYVDDELNALKVVTEMMGVQMEMVSCSKEFALSPNDAMELMGKMFITSPESLGDVSEAEAIVYILVPTGESNNLVIPQRDNQVIRKFEGGKIGVKVQPVGIARGAQFPYKGNDKEIAKAMESNRFLQSDDEKIIALARKAVGGTKDAGEAVKKIEAFVADYVTNRNLSVGYASAVEVAASREGDCTEFAVLTAAMCRAVGIPAKVVMGITYVDEYGGLTQQFGGHAWIEAYVGGKWVGLDSAFKAAGRGGYDAGHIALAVGDGEPADFFNMVTTLGQFEIAQVKVAKKK